MFNSWNMTFDQVRDWWRKLITPGGMNVPGGVTQMGRQGFLARRYSVYGDVFTPVLAATKQDPYARDNVYENIMSDIVDTGVAMLTEKEPNFTVEDTKADQYLKDAWKRNRLSALLHGMGYHGAIGGDVFLKITRPPGSKFARVILLDPRYVEVDTDDDDHECVLEFRINGERKGDDGKTILTCQRIYRALPDVVETQSSQEDTPESQELVESNVWTVQDTESYDGGKKWANVGAPIVWPYSWAPIQHAQGNINPSGYYGSPDLTDGLLAMNDSLNFTTSSGKRNVRNFSHPIVYAKGVPPTTQLTMEPGRINILPGMAGGAGGSGGEIGAVDMPSDIQNIIAFSKYLKESIYQRGRTPDVSSRLQSLGQISGTALKVLYSPLIAKTRAKQQLYGELLERVSSILLFLGGYGERDVTVKFPDPTPVNVQEQANTALVFQQIGIASKETLADEFGFDYSEESTKITEENKASGNVGASLLGRFDAGLEAV